MMNGSERTQRIVFFWNNFGPMHADRVDAAARRFEGRAECVGLELFDTDETYEWVSETRPSFEKITLFSGASRPGVVRKLFALMGAARRLKAGSWFLCHYERPEVFAFAVVLRLTGHRVYLMLDSKFDDFPRRAVREFVKTLFVRPYHGGLCASRRSREYLLFLGLRNPQIADGYDTLSVDRIQRLAASDPAPCGRPFDERGFVVVARHVAKKNIAVAIEAFAHFVAEGGERRLHLLGSGPLEAELKAQVATLGLSERVRFHGFVQSEAVAKQLAGALALILPSTEEQFGLVVIEAQAMGVPMLISQVAGARDALVRNWQNGFVFEPDNPEGLARFMALIDRDEALWRALCDGASKTAPLGDVAAFADGVAVLCGFEGGDGFA